LTLVNLRALTDKISDALSAMRSCYFDRRSDLDVIQSKDDIIHKYLFWQHRSSIEKGEDSFLDEDILPAAATVPTPTQPNVSPVTQRSSASRNDPGLFQRLLRKIGLGR
ncbi:MAG: hypothetical protein ACJ8DZ_04895, partial [Allosphingosinicella sp.]